MHPAAATCPLTCRELLSSATLGIGGIALAWLLNEEGLLAAPSRPELAPRRFDLTRLLGSRSRPGRSGPKRLAAGCWPAGLLWTRSARSRAWLTAPGVVIGEGCLRTAQVPLYVGWLEGSELSDRRHRTADFRLSHRPCRLQR